MKVVCHRSLTIIKFKLFSEHTGTKSIQTGIEQSLLFYTPGITGKNSAIRTRHEGQDARFRLWE